MLHGHHHPALYCLCLATRMLTLSSTLAPLSAHHPAGQQEVCAHLPAHPIAAGRSLAHAGHATVCQQGANRSVEDMKPGEHALQGIITPTAFLPVLGACTLTRPL